VDEIDSFHEVLVGLLEMVQFVCRRSVVPTARGNTERTGTGHLESPLAKAERNGLGARPRASTSMTTRFPRKPGWDGDARRGDDTDRSLSPCLRSVVPITLLGVMWY